MFDILGLTKLQEMKFALLEVAATATPQLGLSCVKFASTSVHIFYRMAEIRKRCSPNRLTSSHVNQVNSFQTVVHHILCCT